LLHNKNNSLLILSTFSPNNSVKYLQLRLPAYEGEKISELGVTLVLAAWRRNIEIFADYFHGTIIAAHAASLTTGVMLGVNFTGIFGC
jgi:hypothetical protein